jgi:hypothetical protein
MMVNEWIWIPIVLAAAAAQTVRNAAQRNLVKSVGHTAALQGWTAAVGYSAAARFGTVGVSDRPPGDIRQRREFIPNGATRRWT